MTDKKVKVRKSNKGGTVELAPVVATGALYVAAAYNKGRKLKGGADVVVSTPGGAVPVVAVAKPEMPTEVKPAVGGKAVPAIDIVPVDVRRESPAAAVTGSAAHSPLVEGSLDLSKHNYIGATAASRPAPVSAPGGLLEGGGKKKKGSRKVKGGNCHPMDAPIPTNAGAGGDIRAVPVVVGAVGGVKGQEEPASFMEGGAKKRRSKGKKKGGDGCGAPVVPMEGGAKKRKSKGKKRGGAEEGEEMPEAEEVGEEMPEEPEVGGEEENGGSVEKDIGGMEGGAKKRKGKGKKRGGADVEPFVKAEAGAPATGGFDNLLKDLQQQVGGKMKKKGGAFKMYAGELEKLSKKLKKLVK